jgi:hypothetical protein
VLSQSMQYISKNEKICILKQMWLTKVLFFYSTIEGYKPRIGQFKELPKISRHVYTPKRNLIRTLSLLCTSSDLLYSTILISFLKSPTAAFNQYILKHGTYNHQNTFTSVSSGQVSFLGVCFKVRKTTLN